MSSKITFGDIKGTLGKVLNLNAADPRVLQIANRAMERLLYEGLWVGTYARFSTCALSGCVTWPRELQTIEAAAVCDCPVSLRNQFYEFIESGPGLVDSLNGPRLTMVDRGYAVAFDDVTGADKKLAVYSDGTEAAGATILLRYYDSNANKVYTIYNGETIEGERIVIPAAGAYAYSTYKCLPFGLYEVIKPITKRIIRLYEYDTVGNTYKPLAYYEPDETLPEYRRSVIPCLQGNGGTSNGCNSVAVTVIGKRAFIPAINDDSVLLISHVEAIRLACQAIFKEEANLFDEAPKVWGAAFGCLDSQLRHHIGSGIKAPLQIQSVQSWGGGIPNII